MRVSLRSLSSALLLALSFVTAPAFAQTPTTVPPPSPMPSVLYVAIDAPPSMPSTGAVFGGWSVNCATWQQPTSLRVLYTGTSPAGAPTLIPLPITAITRGYRPDVSQAIGSNCGGVPTTGVSPWLGWTVQALAPIPSGVHTFWVIVGDDDYAQVIGAHVTEGSAGVQILVQ